MLGGLFFTAPVSVQKPPAHHLSFWLQKRGRIDVQTRLSTLFSPSRCFVFIPFVFIPVSSLPHFSPTHCIFFFLFPCSTRRPWYFPAGRPLLSNSDEWLWLLYRFPNWNNLRTKQVAVYHIDFPPNSASPLKVTLCMSGYMSENADECSTRPSLSAD